MRNSKTLELFESFKNEFEKEPKVINESEDIESTINEFIGTYMPERVANEVTWTIHKEGDTGVASFKIKGNLSASDLQNCLGKIRNAAKNYNVDIKETEQGYDASFTSSIKEGEILTEKRNPENDEANKKIKDVILKGPKSKFYQDVLDMGYKVEPEKEYDGKTGSYYIINPKKPRYTSNYASNRSDINTFAYKSDYEDNRTIGGKGIKKMKAEKRNAIDYKNALDKDQTPRSTGKRTKYGSHKNSGDHSDSDYIANNLHDEDTYDDYNQYIFNNFNSGTEKIRKFRQAKENIRQYEDPHYNQYRGHNQEMYKGAGNTYVSKQYYDNNVKSAEKDLEDFQNSISSKLTKLQKDIDDAKAERNDAKKEYNKNKRIVNKLLKKESEKLEENEKYDVVYGTIELDNNDNLVNFEPSEVEVEFGANPQLIDSSNMKFIGIIQGYRTKYLLFKILDKDYIAIIKFATGKWDSFDGYKMNESEDLNEELYIYSNADTNNLDDAKLNVSLYKQEAPELKFKIHKEGDIYFVDFIGSKENIENYLKKLGWYKPDEIEKLDLIKPYNIKESIKESENKNVSYKVYVDTVFGKIDVVVNAKSEEEAKEIALDRVRDAFVNKYRDDINIDKVLLAESEKLKEKKKLREDDNLLSAKISFECEECGYTWTEDFDDYFEDEDDLESVIEYGDMDCPKCGGNYVSVSEWEIKESEKLEEKINKDNIEINKAIANPNLGKNKNKIQAAGYELYPSGDIKNPKTGKRVWPREYSKEKRKKIDFKGKLDSERPEMVKTRRFNSDIKDNKIPKSAKIHKTEYNNDEVEYYSPLFNDDPKKSISKNINTYKKATKERDDELKTVNNIRKGTIPYYKKQVKDAQDKINKYEKFADEHQKDADDAEERRKKLMDKVRAKRTNESEQLNEKRNPENDKANELIRNSLNDPEYAKTHAQELRKHGIKYLKPDGNADSGALEGKEGRRLKISSNNDWRKDNVRDITDTSYNPYSHSYGNNYSSDDRYKDNFDLHQKGYAQSKEEYNKAKNNIKRQTTKVANMEKKDKEAGVKWNEKTYDAKRKLDDYKDTLKRGIYASQKDTDKLHPDTDLKGFLNAKKHSDRPLPREKDPKYKRYGGRVADPINKDVEDYKANQYEKNDINREKEYNARQDQEDKERIEAMKQRAKEEKTRRDSYINKRQKEANKVDNRINKKLDDFRKRMNK